MKMELWELENYAKQAIENYETMANNAEKSGNRPMAHYFDGICKGISEILDYMKWNEEQKKV